MHIYYICLRFDIPLDLCGHLFVNIVSFVIAHVFWNMYCHCILVHLAWGQSPWHSPPKVGYKPIHRNCTWHMFCANDTCSTLSHQRFLGTKICAAVVCSVVMMWLSATYEFIISYIYIYNMYCMFIYTYAYVCVWLCVYILCQSIQQRLWHCQCCPHTCQCLPCGLLSTLPLCHLAYPLDCLSQTWHSIADMLPLDLIAKDQIIQKQYSEFWWLQWPFDGKHDPHDDDWC